MHGGITNLSIMRSTSVGATATVQYPVGTIYTPQYLQVAQPYTTLRLMEWSDSCYSEDFSGYVAGTDWANRAHPYFCFGADNNAQAIGQLFDGGDEWPWEYAVMFANETGKDLWINVPGTASNTYLYKLAELMKYGSDGVNPYTSATASPVFPPLNPNLCIYIESGNENWGGLVGLPDSQNDMIACIDTAANANNLDWEQYTAVEGGTGQNEQVWTLCRLANVYTEFWDVYGTSESVGVPDPRVRSIYEWQYGGQWSGNGRGPSQKISGRRR